MPRSWPFLGPIAVVAAALVAAAAVPARAQEEEKKLKSVDEYVKTFDEKSQGFFHVYRHKKKVLIEIPEREMERPFFLATSFSGGTTYAGWQWTDSLVCWERYEDKLLLVEKNVQYRAEEGKPIHEVVARTYTDRVVKAMPILAEQRGDSNRGVLIDLKDLLADNAGLFFGGMGANLDASIARFAKIKVFPGNVELGVTMPTRRDGTLLTLHYSLARLPRTGYSPRRADDRVGYFLTAIKDFSRGRAEDDRFVRLVNRWNLQKADPSLKLSPPVKPIVFYIEKTVPIPFRRFVRDGILEWNRAYEKIGFTDAIVVRQQTDTNEFADFDPEDARYNFFRWITSESAFAMGPSRVNPLTGEILDADIIFDDSMVRAYIREYETLLKKTPEIFYTPRMLRFFADHPDAHPFHGTRLMSTPEELREAAARAAVMPVPGGRGPEALRARGACNYGEGVAHQVALAGLALAARDEKGGKGPEFMEEFLGAIVKEVVMHEVGHTLGLRHNFKASSWLTVAEMDGAAKDAATVGSVMDYNPIHVQAPGKKQGAYITPTIGPYDYWAIEYGYRPLDDEAKGLKAITDRVAEKGLAYGTDEDVGSPDPLINRWDLGADTLEFARSRMDLVKALLPELADRVVPEGESYERARRAFEMLLWDHAYAGYIAARYVGGAHVNRDHRGDPNGRAPVQVVAAKKQRDALELVCERVLSDKAYDIPPDLLTKLAAGRWTHWGTDDWGEDLGYPIHERVLAFQRMTLSLLLGPDTLERVLDAELKLDADQDAVSLPELLGRLSKAIYPELHGEEGAALVGGTRFTVRRPFVPSLRRNLQRAYLGELIALALGNRGWSVPPVTRALAYRELKGLKTRLDPIAQDSGKAALLDPYSLAHIEESRARIEKALAAAYQTQ